VYGSIEEIVRFLREIGAVDIEMCVHLLIHHEANVENRRRGNCSFRDMTTLPGNRSYFETGIVHPTHIHIYVRGENICIVLLAGRYQLCTTLRSPRSRVTLQDYVHEV
jgi:hypothetical protein